MTMAYEVSPCCRGRMAGVISVDGVCRPQLVPDDDPSEFAGLLREARGQQRAVLENLPDGERG